MEDIPLKLPLEGFFSLKVLEEPHKFTMNFNRGQKAGSEETGLRSYSDTTHVV